MAEQIVNGMRVVVDFDPAPSDEAGSNGSVTISRKVRASVPGDPTKQQPLRGKRNIVGADGKVTQVRRRPRRVKTRPLGTEAPWSPPPFRF